MNKLRNIIFVFIALSIVTFSNAQLIDLPAFGTDSTFEVITWNIEWFPKNGQITVDLVSEIIQDLDVDLLALQEINDTISLKDMINNLDGYEYYIKSDWYGGLAYVYKKETINIEDAYEIYTEEPFWRPFPRSPLVMELTFMYEKFIIINNHLKCCGDGQIDPYDPDDEETRRLEACNLLDQYIGNELPDDKVILLGDLNDNLTDVPQDNVFMAFLEMEEEYLFTDMAIAQSNESEWSFPNWPSHIDHILITNELFEEFSDVVTDIQTIKLDEYFDGGMSEYDEKVSDHRPVALKLKTTDFLSVSDAIDSRSSFTNYPNPFHHKTTFTVYPFPEERSIDIHNLDGRLIHRIIIPQNQASILWDASSLPTGIYYAKLKLGSITINIRKLILFE